MEIEITKQSVFDRLGPRPRPEPRYSLQQNNKICSFWVAGKCNRSPCRFLHPDLTEPRPKDSSSDGNHSSKKFKSYPEKPCIQKIQEPKPVVSASGATSSKDVATVASSKPNSVLESREKKQSDHQRKLCQYWVSGNCVHGDECKDLHSWFSGSGFSLVTKLESHKKAVTGIALPIGFDKLFTGSKDQSLCVWDCNTGGCVTSLNLDNEIECLISEGSWVFVGSKDAIRAYNIKAHSEHVLTGPNGHVNALAVGGEDDLLFAGVEDGSILAWKFNEESISQALTLKCRHGLGVISLTVGAGLLYSGSKDNSIRVWDMKTFECVHTLKGHTDFVTSLICWDKFLISGSLDKTLKFWTYVENGSLGIVGEMKEESGVLALCGIHDAEAKPILLCSNKDNTVKLYDLLDFTERGRLYAKREVQTISIGCGGLFFTGDATGELFVWRLLGEPKEEKLLV